MRTTYSTTLEAGAGEILVVVETPNPLEMSDDDVVFVHSITDRMQVHGCAVENEIDTRQRPLSANSATQSAIASKD